jgi:hypothetical protein
MAPLRAWLRRPSSSRSQALQNKVRNPRLLLEPLEDRTLLSQNNLGLFVAPTPPLAAPAVEGFYQVLLGRKPQPAEAGSSQAARRSYSTWPTPMSPPLGISGVCCSNRWSGPGTGINHWQSSDDCRASPRLGPRSYRPGRSAHGVVAEQSLVGETDRLAGSDEATS